MARALLPRAVHALLAWAGRRREARGATTVEYALLLLLVVLGLIAGARVIGLTTNAQLQGALPAL